MRRALVVGIDAYRGAPLTGCVADATAMASVLRRHEDESPNYDVRLVTAVDGGERVERPRLRSLLAELFEASRDDELLFYFAGHGAQGPWGTELVTQDFAEHALGVSADDVMTLATNSPALKVVIVLDCCHSGQLGDLMGVQTPGLEPGFGFGRALIRENLTIMAASLEPELAAEAGGHGAFSRGLLAGLEGAAADQLGDVTALSLYAFVSRTFGAWKQRPVFKSNVATPSVLRRTRPFIERDVLRRLPLHFAAPQTRLRLNKGYEGEGRPLQAGQGTPEQRAFDDFKALRNASLLTTDNMQDLYFAAMNDGEVHLTELGQYFWELAKYERL